MILRLATVLHVLAASIYVGGSLFLELVFTPAQEFIPPAQASVIGQRVGRRFAILAWVALLILGLTGVVQLYAFDMLKAEFFQTRVGLWTLVMVIAWVFLVVNGAIMTFWLRPKLEGKLPLPVKPEDGVRKLEELTQASRQLEKLVRVNTAVSAVALVVGASIRYGGLF